MIQLFAIGATILCLGLSPLFVGRINAERGALKLDIELDDSQAEELPAHIAVATAALGAFRGLIVDIMWYRANRLKEEGKFYEANTLSQWITSLQPRYPVVWEFHAWNMAYNISVSAKTAQERWDWVSKGIRLLRDRGIQYNPRSVRLYKELSWIFFHKIDQTSDDAHWYYKVQMCRDWQELLGAPVLDVQASIADVVDNFRPIAAAPHTYEALLEKNPDVAPFVGILADLSFTIDEPKARERTLRMLGQMAMFNYVPQPIFEGYTIRRLAPLLAELRPTQGDDPTYNQNVGRLIEFLQTPANTPTVTDLLTYLRNRVLRENYNMKPSSMLTTMELYGPLDWRHPCAHSLYWAHEGVSVAISLTDAPEQEEIDYINTYRQNVFSLQSLMRFGRISYDPVTNYFDRSPDPRFIDSYGKAMGFAVENIPGDTKRQNVEDSFANGHENFLLQSTYFAYMYGDEKRARQYFDDARRRYGDTEYNLRSGTYTKGLEEWVFGYMEGNLDTMMNTVQFIDAMIRRAIKEGLRNNDLETWEHFITLAKKGYDNWMLDDRSVTHLTERDRQSLPPFTRMISDTFYNMMTMYSIHPLERSRMWNNAPVEVRLATFDRLQPVLYAEAQSAGMSGQTLYPPPPGWQPPQDTTTPAQAEQQGGDTATPQFQGSQTITK
jgi:hypothetical protein